jgi:hypothetical protein
VGAVPRQAQDDERRGDRRVGGEEREIPLLYQTLCQFALGKLNTAAGAVFAESARLPLDLTEQVEAEVARR